MADARDLEPGECADLVDQASLQVARLRVVPCDQAHTLEVYWRQRYRADGAAAATDPSSTSGTAPAASTPAASARAGAAATGAVVPSAVSTATPSVGDDDPMAEAYPGREVLTAFAGTVCAAAFRDYLGPAPARPWYHLTYLVPSSGSWTGTVTENALTDAGGSAAEDAAAARDHEVLCLVRTTGPQLRASVREGGGTSGATSGGRAG